MAKALANQAAAVKRKSDRPRVFLFGNPHKDSVPPVFQRLKTWLADKCELVGSDLEFKPHLVSTAQPDRVITLGGDGTILSIAQAMQHDQVPIIGVNLGKLGYLADFSIEELEHDIDRVLVEEDLISPRMMLDIQVRLPTGESWTGVAMNDCVVRVAAPFRTVGLMVDIDDHPLTTIVSDGLIMATPTGSTAHNMACGGPIVQPDVDAIILTPLCPHSLTHRPVVVGPQCRVGITIRPRSEGVSLVLDGQAIRPLVPDAHVTVLKSAQHFLLVRNPRRKSWDLLVQKLKWGQALA